jgi:peptide/nickel transport system permease protein
MRKYVLNRILQAVITLLFISILVFWLARLTGDPLYLLLPTEATAEDFARARKHLGLDKPLPVQYAIYMTDAFQGDFGNSIKAKIPVSTILMQRLPNSLKLAAFSLTVSFILALVLGVTAAVYKNSALDTISRIVAISGMSIPAFWMGIMFILIFGVQLRLFPVFGGGSFSHYVLPGCVLGWTFSAALMRLLRSSMLEVLDSEYVKMARLKGVAEHVVIWKHALRNALIPVITFAGLYFCRIVGGVVVVETVFALPGLGLMAYEALTWKDYPVIQGAVLFMCAAVLTINLVVDILYAYVNPKIRYQ